MKSVIAKRGYPVFLFLWIALFSVPAGAQQISFSPSTLSFGNVGVGSSKTQAVMVTNNTTRRIGISQASVSGTGYTISGISCPVTLAAGASMSFSVTLAPPYAGTDSGIVSLAASQSGGRTTNMLPRLRC